MHLELHGAHQLRLPETLSLKGDLLQKGSGTFQGTDTHLSLIGEEDQLIRGSPMHLGSITIDKSSGTLHFAQDLVVARQFVLAQGAIDFQGNDLQLNRSGLGGYRYSKGSWRNLGLLSYLCLPTLLDVHNATFPFEDLENGGLRSLQLLGTSSEGALDLQFVEQKGANHDANFLDRDGTPILYQLHSYFRVALSPASENQAIELRISAAGLLVEQGEDLRVVGMGEPAPGTHLPGQELDQIRWGRRKITFEALHQGNFTLGSFREGSVLPLPGKWQDWLLPQKR
jgi:hypothetical protein